MHEIVTLQLGQRANYLGTHYWNTQESYFTYGGEEESPVNHDISFRQGIGVDGSDTYTPRALVYDLKGAFGTLRRENALYEVQQQEQPAQQQSWSGSTIPLQLPPIAPSPYQQALDQGIEPPALTADTVRFWSDYNHLFYHPRSLVQLNDYELHSSLMPFELWSSGEELFNSLDREHDLLDRDLRPLLEECDQLQGLQILSSIDDAWGGFASRYLERIEDEMDKGCRWLWALEDSQRTSRPLRMTQIANAARSVSAMSSSASVYAPLRSLPAVNPPYFQANVASYWQTAALQCAFVESITLPARLKRTEEGIASLDVLGTTLNNDGKRKIVSSAFSVQTSGSNPAQDGSYLTNGYTNGMSEEDHDEVDSSPADIDLFPSMSLSPAADLRTSNRSRKRIFSQVETIRSAERSDPDVVMSGTEPRAQRSSGIRTATYNSRLLFPVLSSFPQIFRFGRPSTGLDITASMSTSSAVAQRLRGLGESSRLLVGVDEREALYDSLTTMAEEYEEGWEDFDESDDDD